MHGASESQRGLPLRTLNLVRELGGRRSRARSGAAGAGFPCRGWATVASRPRSPQPRERSGFEARNVRLRGTAHGAEVAIASTSHAPSRSLVSTAGKCRSRYCSGTGLEPSAQHIRRAPTSHRWQPYDQAGRDRAASPAGCATVIPVRHTRFRWRRLPCPRVL